MLDLSHKPYGQLTTDGRNLTLVDGRNLVVQAPRGMAGYSVL